MEAVFAARLICPTCGLYFDERVFHSECTNCGALLDLDVNTELRAPELTALFSQRLGQLFGAERSGLDTEDVVNGESVLFVACNYSAHSW